MCSSAEMLKGCGSRQCFETRWLVAVVRRAVPLLRYLERFIYPRWTTPFEATRRLVGAMVLLAIP